MKITNLVIRKEELADGTIGLVCRATFNNGNEIAAAASWRNQRGIWASDAEERDPEEIAAHLRNFARAIERAAEEALAPA